MSGVAAVALACFFIGSIPFGIIFARVFGGADIRRHGSGNIGATNVSRVVGFWPAGFLTFLCDGLKGTSSVLLASSFAAWIYSYWTSFPDPSWEPGSLMLRWCAGFMGVAGHCFSPWLRFRGGKGVATGFGAIAILSPWSALVGALGFIITFVSYRIGSLASLSGLLLTVLAHFSLPGLETGAHLVFGGALVFIILARHGENIDALLEKRENQF